VQGAVRGVVHFFVHLVGDELEPLAVEHALLHQPLRETDRRGRVRGLRLALGLGLVEALVVGERVRIEA
jgi:hypothetical protein